MNGYWEKDIQDRFADFKKSAPEGLLAGVQREMQRRGLTTADDEVLMRKKGRRLYKMRLWSRVAVAAMLAILAGVYVLWLMDDDAAPQLVKSEVSTPTPSVSVPQHTASTQDLLADAPVAQHLTVDEQTHEDEVLVVTDSEDEASENKDEPTEQDAQNISEEEESEQSLTEVEQNNHQSQVSANMKSPMDQPKPARFHARKADRKWEIGANVTSVQGFRSSSNKYLSYAVAVTNENIDFFKNQMNNNPQSQPSHGHGSSQIGGYTAADGGTENIPFDNPINTPDTYQPLPSNWEEWPLVKNRNTNHIVAIMNSQLGKIMLVDAHYRQPVRLGLSFRYHFNNRWSMQSGIDYSYHSSDLVVIIDNSMLRQEQKLHFIGVPVMLSYSLWSPGRFNFYVSGGGEVEKMVTGSRITSSVASNSVGKTEKDNIGLHPWQLSVMGNAGIQFNINHFLSLYAEPGVAYYFDNQSSLPTIYQDKPFNFNLNMGFRFNIPYK